MLVQERFDSRALIRACVVGFMSEAYGFDGFDARAHELGKGHSRVQVVQGDSAEHSASSSLAADRVIAGEPGLLGSK